MAAKKTQTPAKKVTKAQSPDNTKVKNEKVTLSDFKAELYALLWAAIGAALAVFLYTSLTGIVGGYIKSLLLGLLGIPANLIPLVFIALGIHMSVKASKFKNTPQYVAVFFMVVIFSAMFHIIFATDVNMLSFKQAFYNGMNKDGGGVFGCMLGGSLYTLFGSAAWVVLISVAVLCLMVSTKWTPIKWILRIIVINILKVKAYLKKSSQEKNADFKEGYDLPFEQINISDIENANSKSKKKKKNKNFNIFKDKGFTNETTPIKSDRSDMIKNIGKLTGKDPEEEIEPAINIYEAPETKFNNKDLNDDIEDADDEIIPGSDDATSPAVDPITESMGLNVALDNPDSELPAEVRHYEKIKYKFPPLNLLSYMKSKEDPRKSRAELTQTAQTLVDTLKSFGVEVTLERVVKGPTVTRYELKPKTGVKVSKIVNLADDIALSLAAVSVRIEAPIPGKAAIGIEVPNKTNSPVSLRELVDSDAFANHPSPLAFAIGKDIGGDIVIADIAKMPHVLIAGATGSGKSVCINSLITSIIYKSDPNDVKFLMIDPKVVELQMYDGIPHLLIPVVTDAKKAAGALNWAVQEMVMRYKLFADNNERNIDGYNKAMEKKGIDFKLPRIVIIIDELADLMMVASKEVEDYIMRLAQMARAAGMHLVIATQRPSVDIITGAIKANIPSRISLSLQNAIDSRTILGTVGAEQLLGNGDMLYFPSGYPKPVRLQGAFVPDEEVEKIVEYIKSHSSSSAANEDILDKIERHEKPDPAAPKNRDDDADELLPQAINLVFEAGQGSASYLQRKLNVGFSRASRMIDQMEERGILGPPNGSKPRELITTRDTMRDAENFDEILNQTDLF